MTTGKNMDMNFQRMVATTMLKIWIKRIGIEGGERIGASHNGEERMNKEFYEIFSSMIEWIEISKSKERVRIIW